VEGILFDREARTRELFREPVVRELLRRHRTGRADHSPLLWAMVCLELWLRQFAPRHAPLGVAVL
jgi:hypothetical protein